MTTYRILWYNLYAGINMIKGGNNLKINVGSAVKKDVIKDAILRIDNPTFTYAGTEKMYMIFECEDQENVDIVRLVKDKLKAIPELAMLYYNVSLGE